MTDCIRHLGKTDVLLPRFLVGVLVVFVVAPWSASYAQWSIEPLVRVGAEIDDNATLSIRTDDKVDLSGFLLEGSAKIGTNSERTDFSLTPMIRSRNYSGAGGQDFDSNDQFLRADFAHEMQSSTLQIRAIYERELVRTAERADIDLDIDELEEIIDDFTGFVGINDRRQRIRVLPTWIYQLSSASAVSAQLDYKSVQYDDAFAGILNDYTDIRFNGSFERQFSQRNTGIASVTARRFETADGLRELSGFGLLFGIERQLTETTVLKATGGVESTEQLSADNDSNFVADVSFVRNLETIRLLAQYRRTISASGAGTLSARDLVSLNLTRKLNDRLSAGLGFRAHQTNGLNSQVQLDDRNYVQLNSRFTWQLSAATSLEFDYRYTFLEREVLGESANSNRVTVWLAYQPRPAAR